MKKVIRFLLLCSILIILFVTSLIQAAPDMIGIINITNGAQMAGGFELKGVVLNNGQVDRVAVKVGSGPWENATGVDRFSYMVNSGGVFGELNIVVGAFDTANNQVAEKTVTVTMSPEKPFSDIVSGEYKEPFNVIFKPAPEVTTYYTIDGTDPKIYGMIYYGPIYVSQNTIIRAVNKSNNNQYSEIATLDLKINPTTSPWFMIQYYEDPAMNRPLTDPAYLKAGTYYLKVIGDRKYSAGPWIDIDAPGNCNDVTNGYLGSVSDCVYQYTRVIQTDFAATGDIQETIKIGGTDNQGNQISDINPTNVNLKAAYPDTQPPTAGSVSLAGGISLTYDPTPQLEIYSTGAAWMRLALSETALAAAPWVEYGALHDEFDISSGGNGSKTIWVEFKDQAGNIQPQHSSTTFSYDNTVLSFDIEYFIDSSLTQSFGKDPYLKDGTYYLKITSNQDLGSNPSVQIDAEGSYNDVLSDLTTQVNPRIYYYTRTIVADSAAVGETREQIMIQGISPSNSASKAAYTDAVAPDAPMVNGSVTTTFLKPVWTWNSVPGAKRYRYSFSDGTNWVATTGTAFTPEVNLTAGSYTLYVQAGDRAGNWSASGSFTTTITIPKMTVKQGTTLISNGSGSFNFGSIALLKSSDVSLTIQNTGNADLTLTGTPVVQVSGADAASFSVVTQPVSTITPAGSSTFTIRFTPCGTGSKTATVSITSNEDAQNPYVFNITGHGYVHGVVTLGIWTSGAIPATGEARIFAVYTTPGVTYGVTWDDFFQGTGVYSTDVKVSAYKKNLTATYFTDIDAGYTTPQAIIPQEDVVYVKVAGYSASSTGSFALKVFEVPPKPVIKVKQGTTVIPKNTGNYNFGNAILYKNAEFSIENTGSGTLNLTGDPKVQISGTDASSFSVTTQPPSSPLTTFKTSKFTVRFNPTSPGVKTATVSITSDDIDNTPYTFTITGTQTGVIEPLPLTTWKTGQIAVAGAEQVYSFNATPGSIYSIKWDDKYQGTQTYTCDVKVSACRPDLTPYFSNIDSGYTNPRNITAQDDLVYIKVEGYSSNYTGSFALRVVELVSHPVINLKQGTTSILNGTGIYNFGNVSLGTTSNVLFTIENNGGVSLNLTGNPRVQISGADASCFFVTNDPSSSILSLKTATFNVQFTPNGFGAKTATVTIPSNDTGNNPYTFTITGNGTGTIQPLTLDTWTPGSIGSSSEVKLYSFETTPGKTYMIAWDDRYEGTGTYTGYINVSAYRQDLATGYFYQHHSGYTNPPNITAAENIVYLKVSVWTSYETGSFALKVYEITPEPVLTLNMDGTNIPNGGNCDIGNATLRFGEYVSFTILNTGTGNLELTGTPQIQISGVDAADFTVTSPSSSPIGSNQNGYFSLFFLPRSTGTKTATISIASNDTGNNPYTFTITGSGELEEELPLDTWTTGNLQTNGEVKTYALNVTPGTSYALTWDDSYQGSGAYTGNISVTAYWQDLNIAYFWNENSGYLTPKIITPQDSKIYIRVQGYNYDSRGSFALKASVYEPVITLKQGTTVIPNGGTYDFGSVGLCSSRNASFTIQNTGGNLHLTNTPKVQLSGPDASAFSVTAEPSSPVAPNSSTYFTIRYTSTGAGIKTATVSIANNDSDNNPYTFTITGTGQVEPLTFGNWTTGIISTPGEEKTYSFGATPGNSYNITWDDSGQGSGSYTGDVQVFVYRQDQTTTYVSYANSGYLTPRAVTAQDEIVYIKVTGYNSNSTGSFALKVSLNEPVMNVKQGTTVITSGTGVYDYGNVSLCSAKSVTFTIQNSGIGNLNLTDTPKVRISGTDAAWFNVTTQPSTPVTPSGSANFTISFNAATIGSKTASVSIANNDDDLNPYTFTINATGVLEGTLPYGTWTPGNIGAAGEAKTYCFYTTPGVAYAITWEEKYNGPNDHTCDVKVSAYREDGTATYFTNIDSGYSTPQVITALDNLVYIKVSGYSSNSTGTFALRAFVSGPVITVKQDSTYIPNGSGIVDFGNTPLSSDRYKNFFIYNTGGTSNLILTDNPKVRISGVDADSFRVSYQATSPITPNGSVTFAVNFFPTSVGTKTATVSIASNSADDNPYTFTITGTGVVEGTLSPGVWTTGIIESASVQKTYRLDAGTGHIYTLIWDDSGQGSGTYTGDIRVSAYREDLKTTYFTWYNDGFETPREITALDEVVYITVESYSSSTGTFALNATLCEPDINIKQGTTDLPNGTGSYSFGDVSVFSNKEVVFTIENTGKNYLSLVYPGVQIGGPDAACFHVIYQPSGSGAPNTSRPFTVGFTPTGPGIKTATIIIENNDMDKSPYTVTITGTGTITPLSLGAWTPGSYTRAGQVKTYSFTTVPGNYYTIAWDDRVQGSGSYNGDIYVTAYQKDLTTTYFDDLDSGYTNPQKIMAQDDVVYVKVESQYMSTNGNYAVKAALCPPEMNIQNGTYNVPVGGSWDMRDTPLGSYDYETFGIFNTGTGYLHLTGNPVIQISGPDAACFSVEAEPASLVAPGGNAHFTIKFIPQELGRKTATISIANDDSDENPYSFTVIATGVGYVGEEIATGGWSGAKYLSTAGETKWYYFNAIPGRSYSISWNDSYQGSGSYTCDIKVSAYRQDRSTAYFTNIDSGYAAPQVITAQENIVYLAVSGYSYYQTGSFALRVLLNSPTISVKQGTTSIPNGTGSNNFGSVGMGAYSSVSFTIQNTGTGSLSLTGSPAVQISGTDASCFTVATQPGSTVSQGGSTTFTVNFAPNGIGVKNAVISIASNDGYNNPYTFAITGTGAQGTGEALTLGAWIPKALTVTSETKTYYFTATPGKTYKIYWDDSYQGSGTYTCDIMVYGYRQNVTTTYFSGVDSGYTSPQTIVAQEGIVYIKVMGYSSTYTGTFALKVVEVI